jgi:serine protease Do
VNRLYFAALLLVLGPLSLAPASAQVVLPDFADLVEKQGPAVVNISTTAVVRGGARAPHIPNVPEDDPFFDFFRRFMPPIPQPREFESRSLGSGFIISSDGFIVTNAHVVEGADEVTVRLTDKREFRAKVVGTDRRTDMALLRIDATGLPRVTLGDPNRLRVGEWVLAIGSPFGFENSVTAGIVSAKGRALPQENIVPFIQTDVAINPGNSGGPLFNLRGEVVGVNSMIYSRTGGFMGVSFAIPIDVAMDIVNQLRATGRVSRGRIGVVIQEVTKELAESFGLKKPMGALVNSVEKGGPADRAGVEPSDVILRFDGKPVTHSADLPRIVAATKPGTKAVIELWRKGQARELTVVVAETPDEKVARGAPAPRGGGAPPARAVRQGLTLSELTPQQARDLKVAGGVLVEDAQGPAARAGLRRGDVITAVNNIEIRSVEQFNKVMDQFERGRNVALLVRRGENQLFIALRIEGNGG